VLWSPNIQRCRTLDCYQLEDIHFWNLYTMFVQAIRTVYITYFRCPRVAATWCRWVSWCHRLWCWWHQFHLESSPPERTKWMSQVTFLVTCSRSWDVTLCRQLGRQLGLQYLTDSVLLVLPLIFSHCMHILSPWGW
jgi:hypothetical protein